jgi:hypothetical protein
VSFEIEGAARLLSFPGDYIMAIVIALGLLLIPFTYETKGKPLPA